jgi:hypothetical protein
MILQPLYKFINFQTLQKEVLELVKKINVNDNQLICQGLENGSNDWVTGVGRIEELEEQEERNYKFISPELRGTLLEKFIKDHNGFRTRIMLMDSRKCYSIHRDPTPRLHLPIITNDQCWMIWPYKNECHQLREGIVYRTDTTQDHTFVNGSLDQIRIHIVMCIDH